MTTNKELVIIVPFKTISVNSQWFVWKGRKILTKEARKMKKDIEEISKPFAGVFHDNEKLSVQIDVYDSWFTKKDGSFRKRDLQNKQKLLIDGIFSGLNLDDCQIFNLTMTKIDSKSENSIVTIKSVGNIERKFSKK